MSAQTDDLEIRPDDIFAWLTDHGWETTESDQWGTVAFRPMGPTGCVRKSRSGHVVAADVAHCLSVPMHLVMQGVQRDWPPSKVQYMAEGGDEAHGRPSQGGGR